MAAQASAELEAVMTGAEGAEASAEVAWVAEAMEAVVEASAA